MYDETFPMLQAANQEIVWLEPPTRATFKRAAANGWLQTCLIGPVMVQQRIQNSFLAR